MGFFAQGGSQIIPIECLDLRVFVGESKAADSVQTVEPLATDTGQLLRRVDGLTAAAGTAAGAGHDFYKVVLYLAAPQGTNQLAGIAQAADHSHPEGVAGNVKFRLFPAVQVPDGAERVGLGIFAGDQIVGRTQGCFHDAAGGAENNACAGTGAQGGIERLVGQSGHIDMLGANHAGDLPYRQAQIYILAGACIVHGRQVGFLLLGHTGHNGQAENPVGVYAQFVGKVGLCHSAEHLLRRFGRGELIHHIRVLGLEEPETWTEFIALLDTLKANGYEVPLAEGLVDQWAVLHYLGTILQRMIDPEVLASDYDPAAGEFTDPMYVTALEKWQQLTTYMGEIATAIDHETARNTMFATGESPIMYLQFAEIPQLEQVLPEGFEYGFFNFPAFEEGLGDPEALTGAPEGFMISNKAENIDACVDFLKWLVSPERGAILTRDCGDISSVDGALTEETALPEQAEALKLIQEASFLAPWLDNACDAAVYVVFGQGGQAIASGDATPESVMVQVQEAAASIR